MGLAHLRSNAVDRAAEDLLGVIVAADGKIANDGGNTDGGNAYGTDHGVFDATTTTNFNDATTTTASSSDAFEQTFGCRPTDTEAVQTLLDAKTITLERLMEIAPIGTVDPTPFLYDTTCYAAAGLMSVAAVANFMIRPLDVEGTLRRLEEERKEKDR